MADNTLNILVKVAGQDELNTLIAKLNKGTATLAEQAQIVKLGTALWRSWDAETRKTFASFGTGLAVVKDMTTKGMEPLASSVAKVSKAYFETGNRIRQFQQTQMFGGISAEQQFRNTFKEMRTGDRVMRELSQTAGGLSNMFGVGGVSGAVALAAGTFQQFEFSAKAIGIATQGASPKIAGMGAKIASMAGVVGGVVAVFGVFLLALSKQSEQVEKLAIAHKNLSDALIASGKLNNAEIIREYEKALKGVNKELKELSPSFLEKFGILHDKFVGFLSAGLIKLESNLNEYKTKNITLTIEQIEKEKKLNDARMKSAEDAFSALDKWLELNKEADESAEKRAKLRQKELLDWFDLQGKMTNLAFEDKAMSGQPISPLVDKQRGWIGTEKIASGFKEAEKESDTFTQDLTQGILSATNTLASGFTQSFGLGQSLLGQFAASIMAVLTEIAAKKAALGLLDIFGLGAAIATGGASLVPTALFGGVKTITAHASGGPIYNPTLGVDLRTGQFHSFAEHAPEWISPMNQMGQSGRGGGGMQPIVNVYNSFNEAGVSTVVEKGDRMNKRRRY